MMNYFYEIRKILLLLLAGCLGCFVLDAQTPAADSITHKLLADLREGRYDSVYARLSADMKRKIGVEELDMMWSGLIDSYDSIVTIGETTVTPKDSLLLTETRIDFAKKPLKLQLSLDKEGRVCGLFFRKISLAYTPPGYINTLAFYELKIPVPGRHIKSEGVLSVPKKEGRLPLVIIVGGSGPTDKDGTANSNKPYKDLAWALAAKGIAVYRFDKRTANPANIDPKHVDEFTMHDEYAIDLQHIISALSRYPYIDAKRIFIMGHSQGGFMLPYFSKACSPVKGYIGLAANFGSLLDLMPYQFDYLADSTTRESYDALSARCRYMAKNLYTKNYDKDSCFPGLTMAYMRHMEENKPAVLVSRLKDQPLLLVQGGRDYQVPPSELELWKQHLQTNKKLEWKVFPKLNHLMMEGERKPGPAEYAIPANVPEYVPDEIAAWILKQ